MGSPEGIPTGESHSLRIYYAYILKSIKDGSFYYGSTGGIEKRLQEHNAGKVRYTKGHCACLIHYVEEYPSRSEAFKREL